MPIVVRCAACGRVIRAADNLAGMIVRCPDCRDEVIIPGTAAASAVVNPESGAPTSIPEVASPVTAVAASTRPADRVFADSAPNVASATPAREITATTPQPIPLTAFNVEPEAANWFVKPPHGPTLGPVSRSRLDEWAQEGRFPPDSRIWAEGSTQSHWAGDRYAFLVPTGIPPPNLDPIKVQPLNADAYLPRPTDDGRAARLELKRRKEEQRKVRRAAALLDALPLWTWWVAGAVCLMVLSLAASAISATLALLAAAMWMAIGVGLFALAFMVFALTLYDEDWFLFFLLAMERTAITCMVVWNLRLMLTTDNPVYVVAYVSGVILSVTLIPMPMISFWFVISRWEDAGICILFQFFGLLCFVCIPLMMLVASLTGHAILGVTWGQ